MTKTKEFSLADILGNPLGEEEAKDILKNDPETYQTYLSFPKGEQEKLLSFIRGKRGMLITYDAFFRSVLDPEKHVWRLESFLSAVLEEQVRIKAVLPRESSKLADSGSIIIMDIIVELSDGTIIDVEMQKVGTAFPGERSSCYVSDFIMRQYNRIKNEKKKDFSFKDLKPVYLIVLMENSSKEFKAVSPAFIHRQKLNFDSGVKCNFLPKIIYISLDTFQETAHTIDSELEAWLTFFSADDAETIVKLVNCYPKFWEMYQEIKEFRRNPRRLIGMYSEALRIMEKNNIKYTLENYREMVIEEEEENIMARVRDKIENEVREQFQTELELLREKIRQYEETK